MILKKVVKDRTPFIYLLVSIWTCAGRDYKRNFTTIPTIHNNTNDSQRYQRFTTIPTIHNDANDSQRYQRFTTIPTIHNDTNDSQRYHLKNSDKECKIYQSSSERLTIFISGFTMKRLDHFCFRNNMEEIVRIQH